MGLFKKSIGIKMFENMENIIKVLNKKVYEKRSYP